MVKITIELDQDLFPEARAIILDTLSSANCFGRYSSYDEKRVKIEQLEFKPNKGFCDINDQECLRTGRCTGDC